MSTSFFTTALAALLGLFVAMSAAIAFPWVGLSMGLMAWLLADRHAPPLSTALRRASDRSKSLITEFDALDRRTKIAAKP